MLNKTTILLCLFAAAASATTLSFDTTDRGWYNSYDYNDPENLNYITGQIFSVDFNDFFGFAPLSGLDGPIVSATLYLYNPAGGYSDANASETLTITEFSGDITTLETAGGNPTGGTVTGEYDALSSGTVFGTATVSAADDGEFVAVTLNAAAIAFLNADGASAFAFGGSLGTFSDLDDHYVFGGSCSTCTTAADGDTYLSLVTGPSTSTVPEPSMLFFILPALVGFVVVRRLRPVA